MREPALFLLPMGLGFLAYWWGWPHIGDVGALMAASAFLSSALSILAVLVMKHEENHPPAPCSPALDDECRR